MSGSTCPVCEGHRFNRETLQVRFKGKSIAEVLEMDVQQALDHFENIPKVSPQAANPARRGLDYLKFGQPSPTLSGGEAKRIKLARELVKKSTGKTLYLLDEPTGPALCRHPPAAQGAARFCRRRQHGVCFVEHNLDVVKTADWVIDLGPEGGRGGGELVAVGTPSEIAKVAKSHTGLCLEGPLAQINASLGRARQRLDRVGPSASPWKPNRSRFAVRQHNLKGIDVEIPRDRMTVCCGMSGSGKSSLAMDTIYAEGHAAMSKA